MTTYTPPIKDMMFILNHVTPLQTLPQGQDLDAGTVEGILSAAGSLAADVLAPLNRIGDQTGCTLNADGSVTTAPKHKEAYAQYRDGGWNGVPFDPAHGGMGLPWALSFAVQEMWQSANMGFGLCPLLNQAAIKAVAYHGTAEQQSTYLKKLVSGEWTGTMHLTEPQAGSDLGLIRSKAEKQADGTYKISGQKIFITYGEHDYAENIIHTVLARTPDAPEGVKGISMFLVPKFIPDANGNPSQRNDVYCTGLEHKLGIHASPTCVMSFGEKTGGATGWLIGEENEGIKYMFTMMNNARLSVGLQGVALAERAYQHVLSYAKQRVQGAFVNEKTGKSVAIIRHADVRRMLWTMKALTEAGRALSYEAAFCLDRAASGDAAAQSKVDLLTPIVKAWCTDNAVTVASLGVQVHGGMGFIEETGAAQFYRDARILPIYEGTNGIQALDLTGRKILRDGGAALKTWIAEEKKVLQNGALSQTIRAPLEKAFHALEKATAALLGMKDGDVVGAVSVPYLNLISLVAGGAILARSTIAAQTHSDETFKRDKIATAEFFTAHILPQVTGYADTVIAGGTIHPFSL
jgi:alkylation response protein AidB-like acyl-CoA dehydrogenase